MSITTKSNNTQTYQLLLYRRALHPELFPFRARRTISHNQFEFEAWIMPGCHVLRFQVAKSCMCELLTDQVTGLPVDGAVTSILCAGEHDFEYTRERPAINYITAVQTETLSDNLYRATYSEILDLAEETESMVHRWTDADGGRCLSVLDIQRMGDEINAQCYHLIAQGGFVLRSQTLFQS